MHIPFLDELSRQFTLLLQDWTCALVVLAFALLLVVGLCVGCLVLYLAEALERWDTPKT